MKRIATAALFLFFVAAQAFGAAVQVELFMSTFLDNDQQALAGGKVYFYGAGGTTAKTVWSDSAMTTAHAQPVVLDVHGRQTIYASGTYHIVVKDASASTTIADYDNLEFVSAQNPNTLVVSNLTVSTFTAQLGYIQALTVATGTWNGGRIDNAVLYNASAPTPTAGTHPANKTYVDSSITAATTTLNISLASAVASLTLVIAAGDASNTAEMVAYDASQTLAIASLSASIVAVTGEVQYIESVATLTSLSAAPTLATLTYFVLPASFSAGWYDVAFYVTAYGQSVSTAPSGVQYYVGHMGATVSTVTATLWSPIFSTALGGPSADMHTAMYLSPAQILSLEATSVSATGIAAQSSYARLSARYLGATKRAP